MERTDAESHTENNQIEGEINACPDYEGGNYRLDKNFEVADFFETHNNFL